jgi:hypothetical protein
MLNLQFLLSECCPSKHLLEPRWSLKFFFLSALVFLCDIALRYFLIIILQHFYLILIGSIVFLKPMHVFYFSILLFLTPYSYTMDAVFSYVYENVNSGVFYLKFSSITLLFLFPFSVYLV